MKTYLITLTIVLGNFLILFISQGSAKSLINENGTVGKTFKEKKKDTVKLVRSLEELYMLPPRTTVIEKCDLSHLGLKEIPSLQLYNIRSLDLSYNELRTENDIVKLPSSLDTLDLNHSNFGAMTSKEYITVPYQGKRSNYTYYVIDLLDFKEKDFPHLKFLDVSYNRI